MPAFQRLMWAQAMVLQSVPAARGTYASPDGTLYSPAGRPLLWCTWDGLYLDSDVQPDTITLSGLWYAAHGMDSFPMPPLWRRASIHRVVQALATTIPDLPTILDEWAALRPHLQAPPRVLL